MKIIVEMLNHSYNKIKSLIKRMIYKINIAEVICYLSLIKNEELLQRKNLLKDNKKNNFSNYESYQI